MLNPVTGGSSRTIAQVDLGLFNVDYSTLSSSEKTCFPFVKNIIIRGNTTPYKVSMLYNTVDYPYRIAFVNSNNVVTTIEFGSNIPNKIATLGTGTVEISVDWDALGANKFNNGSTYTDSHLLLSSKCYASKVAQLDFLSAFTVSPTVPVPTTPTQATNKLFVDSSFLFVGTTFDDYEKAVLPHIKNIKIGRAHV